MNFNFPLVLMCATAFTGVVVVCNRLFWQAKRSERLLDTDRSNTHQSESDKVKEPWLIMRCKLLLHALLIVLLFWKPRKQQRLIKIKSNEGKQKQILNIKAPWFIEQCQSFFPVLLFVFILRSFIVEPFQIPSGSMEPTLTKGDFILVNKFHYGLRMPVFRDLLVKINEPKRGDVMVFFPPNDKRYFIKRVIGLPGDQIEYYNNRLTINGQPVMVEPLLDDVLNTREKYQVEEILDVGMHKSQWMKGRHPHTGQFMLYSGPEGEWTVPEGHYFVMGDNRGNSSDSRYWGFVPKENIVGQAKAIWMHWNDFLSLPSFKRNIWIK